MRWAAFLLLFLTSCAPAVIVIGGGGAATLCGMAAREKGISGTLDDTHLSNQVKKHFFKRDRDWNLNLSGQVKINVQNREVLLTGNVKTQDEIMWAEQITWEVLGVKGVINRLEVKNKPYSLLDAQRDAWITTKVKSALLTHTEIKLDSLNYCIKTVNGVVYVMGRSKSVREQQTVLNTVARIKGVKKVVCLARFKYEILS